MFVIARRRWLAPALVLVAVTAAAGCWRQPGYGPLRQGWNLTEAELTADTVATLQPAWSASVDAGPVRSDPVVSGAGLVHVSDDRAAYGLDLRTGARSWRTEVVPADIPVDQPAHPGSVSTNETQLFVSWSGIPDHGSALTLDAANGQIVQDQRGFIGAQSSTLRDSWRVTGFSGFVEMTLAGAGIRVDGPVTWSVLVELGGTAFLRPPTPAAITANRFFVGLAGGGYGTNVLNGWNLDRNCSTVPQCPPDVQTQLDGVPTEAVIAADEATVYVATDAGTLYAVATATGAVRWTASLGAPVTQRLAWTPTALYVVTDAGQLVVLDPDGCGAATCTPGLTKPLAGAPVTAPAVAGDVVYVASVGGVVEAFPAFAPTAAPAAGGRLWSTPVPGEVTGGPTVAHGTLLVATSTGKVAAFRPT